MTGTSAPLPLDGINVISLEQAVAAPFASRQLSDLGARVIKIERDAGDFARAYDTTVHGEASYFVWINRNKESVVLDLKSEAGITALRALVAKADVFIQNLAPGAIERLGLGPAEATALNPQLIYVSISGYGRGGEYEQKKAYDLLVGRREAGDNGSHLSRVDAHLRPKPERHRPARFALDRVEILDAHTRRIDGSREARRSRRNDNLRSCRVKHGRLGGVHVTCEVDRAKRKSRNALRARNVVRVGNTGRGLQQGHNGKPQLSVNLLDVVGRLGFGEHHAEQSVVWLSHECAQCDELLSEIRVLRVDANESAHA